MRDFKRTLSLIIVLVMSILSLISCSQKKSESSSKSSRNSSYEESFPLSDSSGSQSESSEDEDYYYEDSEPEYSDTSSSTAAVTSSDIKTSFLNNSNGILDQEFQYSTQDVSFVKEIYINVDGSDTNSGAKSKPVKSFGRALQLVEEYIKLGGTGNIGLLVGDGEYRFLKPLKITAAHKPLNGRLYIRPINPGKVYLTGAAPIDTTQVKEYYEGSVRFWSFDFDGDVKQLYINNDRATRARYPDNGQYFRLLNWDTAIKQVLVAKEDVKGIQSFDGVEMVAQIMWAEAYLRIKNVVNNSNGTVGFEIKSPEDYVFSRSAPRKYYQQAYHFENSYQFLTESGEWYYDSVGKKVYYLPYPDEKLDNVKIRIPTAENILKISGDSNHLAGNVSIEGFRIKYTANFSISRGKLGGQGAINNAAKTVDSSRAVGTFIFDYATDINISNNIFSDIGGSGIDIINGVTNSTITRNRFYEVGANGISAGPLTFPAPVSLPEVSIDKNISITDNFFSKIAQIEYGGVGIFATYVQNMKISHNTITDSMYTGISVGWGWSHYTNVLQNNEISYNKIIGAMSMMCDGAGIYTISVQPGTKILENYVDGIIRSQWAFPDEIQMGWKSAGIYLDEGSTGILIKDNVVDILSPDTYNTNKNGENTYEFLTDKAQQQKVRDNSGVEDSYSYVEPKFEVEAANQTQYNMLELFGTGFGSEMGAIYAKTGTGEYKIINSSEYIKKWTDNKITLKVPEEFVSGKTFVVTADEKRSNGIMAFCNTSYEDFNVAKYEPLDDLVTRSLPRINAKASSVSNPDTWGPEKAIDSDSETGWSMGSDYSQYPWLSFELTSPKVISKIIIPFRSAADQPSTRSNFRVLAATKADFSDAVVLYAQDATPLPHASMLTIEVKDKTAFKYFKVIKTDKTYFFIADVMVFE